MLRAMVVLLAVLIAIPGTRATYGNVGANAMRNGQTGAAGPDSTPGVVWNVTNPDRSKFIHTPVLNGNATLVYASSVTGFVYAFDTATGDMVFEACVGTEPDFPGDPCGDTGFQNEPYGELTVIGSVVVVPRVGARTGVEVVAIDGVTGDVVWRYALGADAPTTSLRPTILSFPTGVREPATGLDLVLFWVGLPRIRPPSGGYAKAAVYTVLEAETGIELNTTQYLTTQMSLYAPMVFDPSDGTIVTQRAENEQPACGTLERQYMKCMGLAKYTLRGDRVLWKASMGTSMTMTGLAIDPVAGLVHVPGQDVYSFAYQAATGKPVFRMVTAEATTSNHPPAVCDDGTVVYSNNEDELTGWSPAPARDKEPLWRQACKGPGYCSLQPTVASNGLFLNVEGNTVTARACATGNLVWHVDLNTIFSGVARHGNPVAIGPDGSVYAVVVVTNNYDSSGVLARLR